LTPEVAPMRKHFKTLTNFAITLMPQQEHLIKSLETIITDLQLQITALQKPQLMYRPPESEKHVKVAEYLDSVEERLRKLEKNAQRTPTVYLDDINTPSL